MVDLVILFTHYRDDAVTRPHFELLRRHNPGVPVVPLVDGAAPFLPGTVDVAPEPWHWGPDRDPWANADTLWYRWSAGPHAIPARRYVVVESDVRADTPVAGFLAPAWDADVAVPFVATPASHPGWDWWGQVPRLGDLARHATGAAPLSVTLLSGRALATLAASRLDAFCELRVGTEARAARLDLRQIPGGGSIQFREHYIRPDDRPGDWHPIKEMSRA